MPSPRFIDLHCHYLPAIDDGARDLAESRALLEGLYGLGFECVVATPHMRPGLFDNEAPRLREVFEQTRSQLTGAPQLPRLCLGAEHYFDDVVFGRILSNQALPYPGGRAILLEFYEIDFPHTIDHRLADLKRRGLTPVIAHPERYRPLWGHPDVLERLLDVGAAALLDTAALVGKYGRQSRKAAEELLDLGLYRAACSDAHRPDDVREVARGMEWIVKNYGDAELEDLFVEGPRTLLGEPTATPVTS